LQVKFTDRSTGSPTSWYWNFGDGTNSTQKNPTHTYSARGNYTVSLTATNKKGNDTETKSRYIVVTVPQPPVADFRSSVTSGTTQLIVAFTDTSTRSPTSWFWDFGDRTNSTVQNPVHKFSKAGKYTVSLRASNAGGSNTLKRTNYMTVTSPRPPTAAFIANRVSGKVPLAITFTDTSTGTPASWNWSFGDGTHNSTVRNPSHTFSKAGKYTISLTSTNANGVDTETKKAYITVTR
jgi:PKD repeat protein